MMAATNGIANSRLIQSAEYKCRTRPNAVKDALGSRCLCIRVLDM